MIIIDAGKPWPKKLVRDFTDAFARNEKLVPVSAKDVVTGAIQEWIMKSPAQPTHLVIPLSLKNDFASGIETYHEMVRSRPVDSHDDHFLGMKILWSRSGPMEMLTGEAR